MNYDSFALRISGSGRSRSRDEIAYPALCRYLIFRERARIGRNGWMAQPTYALRGIPQNQFFQFENEQSEI
jgi:hypothetical protein